MKDKIIKDARKQLLKKYGQIDLLFINDVLSDTADVANRVFLQHIDKLIASEQYAIDSYDNVIMKEADFDNYNKHYYTLKVLISLKESHEPTN